MTDITNQKLGKLTAMWPVGKKGKSKHVYWLFACDCGGYVVSRASTLLLGNSSSCGCINPRRWKHGQAPSKNQKVTPEYRSWCSMKRRCLNAAQKGFKYWGGRGITICPQWLESFEQFLADMGPRPKGKTIDRYPDNNGNYEPTNCRWATPKEQAANRRAAGA